MSEDIPERLRGEEPGSEHLSYEGDDLPWYVTVMWVVSLLALASYTWVYYVPALSMWLSR